MMAGILDRLPPPTRSGTSELGEPSHVWIRPGGHRLRLRMGPDPVLSEFCGGDCTRTVTGSYELISTMALRWLESHAE